MHSCRRLNDRMKRHEHNDKDRNGASPRPSIDRPFIRSTNERLDRSFAAAISRWVTYVTVIGMSGSVFTNVVQYRISSFLEEYGGGHFRTGTWDASFFALGVIDRG